MLPSAIARTSVVVLTAPTTSDHGRLTRDWGQTPTEVTVDGCSWQPNGGADDLANREGAQALGQLFMPPDATIAAHNRVRIDGDVYTIRGEPARWGTGLRLDHIVVQLERWQEAN
jgi:hypothetical protein